VSLQTIEIEVFEENLVNDPEKEEEKGRGNFDQKMQNDKEEETITNRLKKRKLNEDIMSGPFVDPKTNA